MRPHGEVIKVIYETEVKRNIAVLQNPGLRIEIDEERLLESVIELGVKVRRRVCFGSLLPERSRSNGSPRSGQ